MKSRSFALGIIRLNIDCLLAAITFSRIPPTANTFPVKVNSPVIAIPAPKLLRIIREIKAVAIVIPALGPSLGVAPSGTCK